MIELPDWNVIAAAVFGLFVIYFLSRAFFRPIKFLLGALLHLVLGGAVIFIYNLAGAFWGLTIGLNVFSALAVGVMGLPGLAMLVALRYILI
ncbi:MAG: pro-sigmaK processing inhibitor BofA family protein [Bacillota bacterium]